MNMIYGASSSSSSAHLLVNTNYTSTIPLHGVIKSDVRVERAIDYFTRINIILSEMKDGRKPLFYMW